MAVGKLSGEHRSGRWPRRGLLAGVSALALLLGACGQAEQPGGEATAPESPAGIGGTSPVATAPEPGGDQTLVVGAGDDRFQSPTTRPRLTMYPLNADTCETLIRMDEQFGTQPGLATDWELVGENTYRFHLREGVTFHNGEPFTAEAVRYSMQRLVEHEIDFLAFLGPDSVEIIDDHTVEITPEQPNLRLPQQIVHPSYSIVAPGTEPADEEVVCTGPFRFVEYVPNDRVVVERFEDYWGEPAKLDRITFRFIPDDQTRRLALEAGQVDVIFDVPRAQVSDIEAHPDLKLATADPGAVMVGRMNVVGAPGHEILTEVPVRRALGLSLNRQAFVDLWGGHAEIVPTVNPPAALGEHAALVEGFTYDPDQARQILEEAGWTEGADGIRERDGQRLSISLLFSQGDEIQPLELLQAHARDVGIDVRLEPLPEGASMSDKAGAGEFDLTVWTPNQNDANPSFLLTLQWWSESRVPWTTYQHPGGRFDDLVAQSLEAPSLDEARKLAAEAQQVLIDELAAAIPIVGVFRIYAMKAEIEGFQPHPSRNNQRWATVYRGS